jgi:tRNA(Ile)-lysidine synthase
MKLMILNRLPSNNVYLAYSGGEDSSVLLHYLLGRNFKITLLHVNHKTEACDRNQDFCIDIAERYDIDIICSTLADPPPECSKEAFWSRARDVIFQGMDKPVLTAHHLGDATEWYVMSAMQGCAKLMNYNVGNVYRPLLLTTKEDITAYAYEHKVEFFTDMSNFDTDYALRNKVRIQLLPEIKKVFPGVANTVKRMIIKKENSLPN